MDQCINAINLRTIQESETAKNNAPDIIQVSIALEIPLCSGDLPWFIVYTGDWIHTKENHLKPWTITPYLD